MLIGTIGALVFPELILSAFDAEPSLMKYGTEALRIIGCGFIISTVGVVCSGVFEAFGKGGRSLTVSLLRQFIITIPLGIILSFKWGANGIWVSFPISELIAAIVAYVMLIKLRLPKEDNV